MKQNLLLRNILNKVFQKVLRISYIRIISLTLLTIVLTSYKTTDSIKITEKFNTISDETSFFKEIEPIHSEKILKENTTYETFGPGNIIIPMSNALQSHSGQFNMKAYGLIVKLLHGDIPMKWAIKPNKSSKSEIDFYANTRALGTSNSGQSTTFRYGAFIVYPGYESQAQTIINNFGNNVKVLEIAQFNPSIPIYSNLLHKPKALVITSKGTGSKEMKIHTNIYDAAGLSGSTYYNEASNASGLTSSSCYTFVSSPHSDYIYVNQIRTFLQTGGNYIAQCKATRMSEDHSGGLIMTNGIVKSDDDANSLNYSHHSDPISQFDGNINSEEDGPGGDTKFMKSFSYKSNAFGKSFANHTSGTRHRLIGGKVPLSTGVTAGGHVYYLGGHDHAKDKVSTAEKINAWRTVMNAFLIPADRNQVNSSCNISICSPLTDGGDINGAITNHCNSTNPGTIPNVTPPTGGSGGNITYKWQKRTGGWTNWGSWTDISNTDAWNYNPPFITESTQYRRLVRRCTNDPWLISTSQRTFIIEKNPTNGGTISGGTVVCTTSYNPPIITENTPPDWTGGGGRDYRWQYRTGTWSSWSGWITITSATSKDYDPPSLNATRQYRRGVKRPACPDNTSNWKYSNNVTFEFVQNHTDGGTIAADEAYCNYPYNPANIVSVNGPSGGCCAATQFQWQESTDNASWTNISGATSNTYDPPTINVTTYYRRGATITGCPYYIYSNVVTKAVLKNYTYAGKIKSDEAGCSPFNPSNMVGDAPPSGGSGGTKEHQWQKSTDNVNWTDISGATNGQYNPNNITQTTYYRRGVRRHDVCPYIYSNVITKTVIDNYTSGGSISGDESKCGSYDPSKINSTAGPNGGQGGTKKHQWQKSTDNINWTDISGATSEEYNPNNITQTTYYRRGARRSPCSSYKYTNVVTKAVTSSLSANASPDVSICDGNSTTITASASGGSGSYDYTWNNGLGTGQSHIVSPTTTTTYTVTVTDLNNNCTATDDVTVTVIDNYSNGGIISGGDEKCDEINPSFISNASGPGGGSSSGTVEYRWEYRTGTWNNSSNNWNWSSSWNTVPGANSQDYTTPLFYESRQYKRGAKKTVCSQWKYSNSVTFTVVKNYSYEGSISGDESKCGSYDPLMINSTADPSGGQGGTLEIIWESKVNGGSWTQISNANGLIYDPLTINETTYYRRGARRSPCSSYKYTNVVTKAVTSSLSANASPDVSICDGNSTTITASASGGSGSYDYTWNNGLGTGQSHIVSPTTTTTYTVTVTDLSNNCTATDQVTVTVMSIPNITGTSSTDEICSSSNGSITIYFTDDPSRSAIEFSIDGGSSYPYNTPDDAGSFVISNLSAGTYNLYARWSGGDCPISQGSIVIKNYFLPSGCNPEVKFEKTINVDTARMQETVFYTFTISNNAGGVLDNVTFVDMLTYGGLFFSDPFDMTNGIQVLGQTINQNSANLTLNNIPVGISTFKLTVDIPANLVQWSTYCNQASIGNLQASNPNLPSDNILSDDPSTPTVGDPTCVLVKIYENCCNGTDDDGDGLADCDDSDCN